MALALLHSLHEDCVRKGDDVGAVRTFHCGTAPFQLLLDFSPQEGCHALSETWYPLQGMRRGEADMHRHMSGMRQGADAGRGVPHQQGADHMQPRGLHRLHQGQSRTHRVSPAGTHRELAGCQAWLLVSITITGRPASPWACCEHQITRPE